MALISASYKRSTPVSETRLPSSHLPSLEFRTSHPARMYSDSHLWMTSELHSSCQSEQSTDDLIRRALTQQICSLEHLAARYRVHLNQYLLSLKNPGFLPSFFSVRYPDDFRDCLFLMSTSTPSLPVMSCFIYYLYFSTTRCHRQAFSMILGITLTYQRVAKSQVSFVHLRVMLRADGERMHPRLRFSYL